MQKLRLDLQTVDVQSFPTTLGTEALLEIGVTNTLCGSCLGGSWCVCETR
jgi:hypothetical protein